MNVEINDLLTNNLQKAKDILINNNRGGYTIPSSRLYPFQWNWDSGFIALGLAYCDPQKAMDEVTNMFKGQWSNGMLPHINFHHIDPNYFPGPEIWGTKDIPWRPNSVLTSGITQPPVFAFILERMTSLLESKIQGWDKFLKEIFPKIVSFHRYLYTHRDPYNEGLVYIHHNWEAGTDNSPNWDEILNAIDVTGVRDVSALRRDIKNVDASQRPTNENYKRYIYLIDLFIRYQYNDEKIVKDCPFLVQDVLFNSLLVKSNYGLIALAEHLHLDAAEIKEWNKKTIEAINSKLWDKESDFYFAYDLKNKKSIPIKTSSGFMPLFAGICNDEQVEKLTNHLTTSFIKNDQWKLCPSTAADEDSFNAVKYWRGPVWINVNWMIFHGLIRYGKKDLAKKIKADSLDLIENIGMYEYFDPRPANEGGSSQGLGADAFSWSAALYLDFINNPQPL
ncbi:MAG TPA: trehalase family glycosidase [Chitinophagaceae bacterium]|jgi:neutral trehalase|nr:trehalase family glycosidase [Chitinophagaceae bacterium]